MKLIYIGTSFSPTKIIKLENLKDQRGNDLELPPDPENNLVFDPRPIQHSDYYHWTFDIEIQYSARLVVTRTDKDDGWDEDIYFRVYDRTKENVPVAFDSSVPYDYWGLYKERAPKDTVVAKVHHTAKYIGKYAFWDCEKMISCDMSNAPVEQIGYCAFCGCDSLRTILFSKVLRKIYDKAFFGCSDILDVLIIPSTVTEIGEEVFQCCPNLRILKLPDTIKPDNIAKYFMETSDVPLNKLPPNQEPKQWLKHRYDPYPLHKVCYNAHVTIEEIQQCIQAHPHAAYLSDEFDMTALHMITIMACTSNLQVQNQSHNQDWDQDENEGPTSLLGGIGHITACFDGNMSAAFAPDDRRKTPLDYLLESCDGLDVHTALVTSLCLHRSAS